MDRENATIINAIDGTTYKVQRSTPLLQLWSSGDTNVIYSRGFAPLLDGDGGPP